MRIVRPGKRVRRAIVDAEPTVFFRWNPARTSYDFVAELAGPDGRFQICASQVEWEAAFDKLRKAMKEAPA